MSRPERFCLIAGGGTAGHLHPGLAVAKELVARGHTPNEILFVGGRRGIEKDLVPKAGFELRMLAGQGLDRRLRLATVKAGASLTRGVVQGMRVVSKERPQVVLSLGGYASVPCGLGAALSGVPVVVAEQNAVPGAANRLVARSAKASAVSFPGTALPRAVLTGNPVREEVLAVDRDRDRDGARTALGTPAFRTMIAVFGGSLGALRLNRAVFAMAEAWRGRSDLAVYHVIGNRDWNLLTREREAASGGALWYRAIRYEDDMPTVFAAADLVICRAGASSVAEIAAVGLPSILVPLPGAPGDHQTANALALVRADASVLVTDAEMTAGRLVPAADALLADAARRSAMGTAARAASHRDAAVRVADLLEEHARG
jgi:undecaprenyldiphospho-muramoylpentapeptide beta-N-acetylglucosaminyltransferase